MNTMLYDLRYALRHLRRAPGFTLAAIVTLSLGIGASAAIFCLMDAHWLHPMAVPHSGELVRVFATTPQDPSGMFTYSEYQALQQRATSLKSVVALGRRGSIMPRTDGSTTLLTNVVSSNFFEALGVKPDSRPRLRRRRRGNSAHPSRRAAWLRFLAARIRRRSPYRRPADHAAARRRHIATRSISGAFCLPIFAKSTTARTATCGCRRKPGRRLRSPARSSRAIFAGSMCWGVSLTRHLLPRSTTRRRPSPGDGGPPILQINHDRGARAVSDFRYRMANAGTSGLVLFAIVASVVLLATVNVAHLLLARALARGPEVALRMALGARRITLARQLLVENLLLCVLSLAAGLGHRRWQSPHCCRACSSANRPCWCRSDRARTGFQMDWRVFLFASAMALATMLLLASRSAAPGVAP